jgi:predicted ATP-dependent endonuclease of OLD family
MKIESVRIKNLRSFADVTVPFNDFTCLVGPNGSGKSTILCALSVFFRGTENASTDLSHRIMENIEEVIDKCGDWPGAFSSSSETKPLRETSSLPSEDHR